MKAYGTVEISFNTFLISKMTSHLLSLGATVSRSSPLSPILAAALRAIKRLQPLPSVPIHLHYLPKLWYKPWVQVTNGKRFGSKSKNIIQYFWSNQYNFQKYINSWLCYHISKILDFNGGEIQHVFFCFIALRSVNSKKILQDHIAPIFKYACITTHNVTLCHCPEGNSILLHSTPIFKLL
jgi:hypothetical protein